MDIPKSMKPSKRKGSTGKIQRRSTDEADEALADRFVACIIAGFNEAQRTGKFPKVY